MATNLACAFSGANQSDRLASNNGIQWCGWRLVTFCLGYFTRVRGCRMVRLEFEIQRKSRACRLAVPIFLRLRLAWCTSLRAGQCALFPPKVAIQDCGGSEILWIANRVVLSLGTTDSPNPLEIGTSVQVCEVQALSSAFKRGVSPGCVCSNFSRAGFFVCAGECCPKIGAIHPLSPLRNDWIRVCKTYTEQNEDSFFAI
jgi:hypothetical protein